MPATRLNLDGNEAAAHVAYRSSEVCAIYPITPSSTMGELADQWAAEGMGNIWGNVPTIVEMQSEAGVSGAVHGALQTGALCTTFTASQGLLLMIPNLYKIAGELTCTVFHVAARSVAAQALSIFGDHSDVMAVRSSGWAMLASSSVQQAHDMALIAQAATLETRLPFIHFFDGFRTSHEINCITLLSDEQIRAMIDDDRIIAHRQRALNPDRPFMRGTAQNPDVFFQARETVNPFYSAAPAIVARTMARFAELTGRHYRLFNYYGDPEAERVVVLMGSGSETFEETVDYLMKHGEKVGIVRVHLYRPFSVADFLDALPPGTRAIAVLDRTKEPGSIGEPLYQDVVTALAEGLANASPPHPLPRVIGGRYGLSSKEFTPAMAKAVFDELARATPKNHFTVGIHDDVSGSSLDYDRSFDIEPEHTVRALFYGLGADGTVGANKNSIKIIGEDPAIYAQAYFVYDSKKSGSMTVSHLRFGPEPIRSTYLIGSANFVACHQFGFLDRMDILSRAAHDATLLLNSPYGPEAVWDQLPRRVQQQIIDKGLRFFVIDALRVARESGMGTRINTIMQTCFFAISGVLSRDDAIARIKEATRKTYGKKGEEIVKQNFEAIDRTLADLYEVQVPTSVSSKRDMQVLVPDEAPTFVREVTAAMMRGQGDELPTSKLPIDGTYPTGTTRWEKRRISDTVPVWEPDLCIQCGNCSFVCPHSVIRSKFFNESRLDAAPPTFKTAPLSGRGFPESRYTLQIYVEDCTGCALCVEVCPAKSMHKSGLKAINMRPLDPLIEDARESLHFFETLPENDRGRMDFSTVRGAQYLRPMFEFSGACAGCGETPYLKLISQLFGDRMIVANATGCSSIYGGNLPTTPWSVDDSGRGPAWSNSLFEDNAEFGLGFRLTADNHRALAEKLLRGLGSSVGEKLVNALLNSPQIEESQICAQRGRVENLKSRLRDLDSDDAKRLLSVCDHLVRRSIWIVGGDGWAYDIGYGGLDHVLASGRNLNILVLDTEVYSNTGGQMSKSTPMAAVAKFAASGKSTAKKDLALQAIAYGDVYVARIAMGANPQQTLLALREAETYPGPSLILAYAHCIAHGINMQYGLKQQKLAVECGHWPLLRYNPALRELDQNPFMLDSHHPSVKLEDYAYNEIRYRMLTRTHPERAQQLMALAQENVYVKWRVYEEMATRGDPTFQFTRKT
jgi:pyruvate-ferredoxin/flavodoxin oxidoreductase